jgi:hypothetical protein
MVYCYICKLHDDKDNLELDDFQSCEFCNFNLCNICYIQHHDELLPEHPYQIECFICLKKTNDRYIKVVKDKILQLLSNNETKKMNITTQNEIKELVYTIPITYQK